MDKTAEKTTSHDEWWAKIKAVSEANQKEHPEAALKEQEEKDPKTVKKPRHSKLIFFSVLIIFFIALIPRLYFIFVASNPDNPGAGWFGDAYHHWQIAYLTKEIGLSHGFLRLWDLKGMEYFWGLLHPFIMLIAFALTGLNTVGLERTITAIFGSFSCVLIFLIVGKNFNYKAAVAAALLAALNPVGVFNDGSGMVEPLGIPFLLLGVYYWPTTAWASGIFLSIALMARAEYWAFSIGLVICMLLFTRTTSEKKIALALSFIIVTGLYVKYLLGWTGDPIYPFYQNFMANYIGTWQLKPKLDPQDIQAKYIFLSIFIVSMASSLLIVWKKPRGMFLYLAGLANWIFLGAMFGLGEYIKSYMSYVWYVRFMLLPYMFLGIVFAVIFFYYIPKIKGLKVLDMLKFNWLILIAVLVISQSVWGLILSRYLPTQSTWDKTVVYADGIAQHYKGGSLLLFEGNPEITYALVRFNGVEGKNIVGEMFDPYFYLPQDPYKDWQKNRKIVLSWIKKYNVRTIATYVQYTRYKKLVDHEPQFFYYDGSVPNTNFVIYQVKDELYQTNL